MCTHGIAAQCKKQLSDKLQNRMFSLNADEATNVNDRILNVLVRFFDEDMKVVTQHLGPKKLNIADASAITSSIEDILQCYSLNWDQVVSVLLDNCSVMRGKRIRDGNPDSATKSFPA